MSTPRSAYVIGFMALVIAGLSFALVYFARDELHLAPDRHDDDITRRSALSIEAGYPTVKVSGASQAASGIQTRVLAPARARPTLRVHGVVLPVQGLLEMRTRLRSALAEVQALQAAQSASAQEARRVERLFDDERNLSERALQAARAQSKQDAARLAAAAEQVAGLRAGLQAGFGTALARLAEAAGPGLLEDLGAQRQVLVQVAVPAGAPQGWLASLKIGPAGQPGALRGARLLSSAPQADGSLSGETYLYAVAPEGLRAGMRVSGHLEGAGAQRDGVAVPASAVIWHGGRAWAYVREEDNEFVRHPVATAEESAAGWFNESEFEPGDEIVVSGAQLLLSEEQKSEIRNENQD